jgi:hypothetical protein
MINLPQKQIWQHLHTTQTLHDAKRNNQCYTHYSLMPNRIMNIIFYILFSCNKIQIWFQNNIHRDTFE